MSSLWSVRSFENKEFTGIIDCFQNKSNEIIGVFSLRQNRTMNLEIRT